MRQTLKKAIQFLDIYFITITSCLFILLRLPSLFEPYWYGDEGVYQVIGMALNQGKILYQGIWDNKPPLLYLIYAFFQSDQSTIRFFSLATGVVSLILFYQLSQKLFQKRTMTIVSTIIFAVLFGTPLLEGNIANAENFIIPCTLLAALITINLSKEENKEQKTYHIKKMVSSSLIGLILGIAILFKTVAIFDVIACCTFLLFAKNEGNKNTKKSIYKNRIYTIVIIAISFCMPFLLTAIYFNYHQALKDFIQSAFLDNIGYVSYGNQLIIPQGFLILKTSLLAIYIGILFLKRKSLPKTYLFIYIWLGFSLFDTFFSQKPYTHYLLMVVNSLSLFTTIVLFEKRGRLIIGSLFIGIIIIIAKNFSFYQNNLEYYQNFLRLVTNQESMTTYRGFFDQTTVINYDLAEYINMHSKPTDKVFIWTNYPELYKLINKLPPGKFLVAYHITWNTSNTEQTIKDVQKSNPKYIIIMPNAGISPISLKNYRQAITVQRATIYEHT